jgi:hypothetical protein
MRRPNSGISPPKYLPSVLPTMVWSIKQVLCVCVCVCVWVCTTSYFEGDYISVAICPAVTLQYKHSWKFFKVHRKFSLFCVCFWVVSALSKRPNRVVVTPFAWGRKQIQFPKSNVLAFYSWRWTKSRTSVLLNVTHHRQNPLNPKRIYWAENVARPEELWN